MQGVGLESRDNDLSVKLPSPPPPVSLSPVQALRVPSLLKTGKKSTKPFHSGKERHVYIVTDNNFFPPIPLPAWEDLGNIYKTAFSPSHTVRVILLPTPPARPPPLPSPHAALYSPV
ncbi:hypothetical protein JRQ81_000136 [Phrynocephalus forsythii]|uniref:Uncharacterized protein n=1 Tax=Phrynocephalus forsythii TaxID=171643 RepID=A0A9Q0Y723_9SAUR|nr:hypothetical protein JRQ81_000136 [Phrynocephalus forsythii]